MSSNKTKTAAPIIRYDPATMPSVVVPAPVSTTLPPASPYNQPVTSGYRSENIRPDGPSDGFVSETVPAGSGK